MDFQRYSSIENSYRTKFINKIREEGKDKGLFVVQEKVHGANFSFWITKDEIRCAKRSSFVGRDGNFYNFQRVLERYEIALRNLFNSIVDAETVVVYGELFGGNYPHKDVDKVDIKTVQKGVHYNNDIDFIGFDIKVDGLFLDMDQVGELLGDHEIPYTEILKTGTLEECLEYPNEFQTTIPAMYGLPEIENNICEGVVIKPLQVAYLWDKSRVVLKNKNAKFSEKTEKKQKAPPKPLEPVVVEALEKVTPYVSENRLRNVISKIGDIGQKDFGKLMGLFTKDVIEDFMKDEEDFFNGLEKEHRKLVTKKVGQSAASLMRANFANIVDGEF